MLPYSDFRILSRLVSDPQTFIEESWDLQPVLTTSASDFSDLLSLDAIDAILNSGVAVPSLRMVRDGQQLSPAVYTRTAYQGVNPIPGLAVPRHVINEVVQGATLILQGLHRFWLPLQNFVRALSQDIGHRAQANAYLTPAESHGFDIHYDMHGVFILQVAGSKEWEVREPGTVWPTERWHGRSAVPDTVPHTITVLTPGDSLYIPRGWMHCAATQSDLSLHITIGFQDPLRWVDVFRYALNDAAEQFEDLRGSLPVRYRDRLAAFAVAAERTAKVHAEYFAGLTPEKMLDLVAARGPAAPPPLSSGYLTSALRARDLQLTDRVRLAPLIAPRLIVEGSTLRVDLGDAMMELPIATKPVVDRILTSELSLRPIDLCDQLTEESALILIRRLVEFGLLTYDQAESTST